MTRLVCVPVEPTEEQEDGGAEDYVPWIEQQETGKKIGVGEQCKNVYRAMVNTAPPLPPDLQEALELAKKVLADLGSDDEHIQLARALLKSHGREG